MAALLNKTGIRVPFAEGVDSDGETSTSFDIVNGSVLLQQEHQRAKHVKLTDFPDRTGFESFVNHVHFSLDGTPESIASCLQRAIRLKRDLARLRAANDQAGKLARSQFSRTFPFVSLEDQKNDRRTTKSYAVLRLRCNGRWDQCDLLARFSRSCIDSEIADQRDQRKEPRPAWRSNPA